MKPRSLVFNLFGDYLRYRGGDVRLRGLVALMGGFDIPEPTARVVANRLRVEGWLEGRRDGRETVYALTDRAWSLLDEGRARIFNRARGPWDGQWHMVAYSIPESERALRERLRKKLAWWGFGPLYPGVWLSPHDRVGEVQQDVAHEAAVQLDVFRSRSAGLEADRDIASRAWDLKTLDRDYADLVNVYRARLPDLRTGAIDGAAALIERIRLIHDYRMFPFRDPDLPPELLPPDWHGRLAHDLFVEAHGLLRPAADAYVDEVLGR